MANDCLVTKLKSSVQNTSLPKIGEISIDVNSTFAVRPKVGIDIRCDKNAISLVDGGPYTNSVHTEATVQTNVYVNEKCKVFIPQYLLVALSVDPLSDINAEYIGYSTEAPISLSCRNYPAVDFGIAPANLYSLAIRMSKINFSLPSYPKLHDISFTNTNNSQSINVQELVSKAPALVEYKCYSDSGHQTGTFEDFGNAKNITTIYGFSGTGTMEGFVAAQRLASGNRAARPTGSVTLLECRNITFQGVANLVTFNTKTLSWTADTITFDGTTISA